MLAGEGARVVVNDVGAARDGVGEDAGPAQQVVDEIRGFGGEAVANTDDISSWAGARLVQQAIPARRWASGSSDLRFSWLRASPGARREAPAR